MMKRGFTLLELVVVVIIIGILAALAIPQYMITTERARSAEGVIILGAIRGSQERYRHTHQSYAITTDVLDFEHSALKYFGNIHAANDPSGSNYIAAVQRTDGTYWLFVKSTSGSAVCYDDQTLCEKLGFPWVCFLAGTSISLADGTTKPIEKMMAGEMVLGYDGQTVKPAQVMKVVLHPNSKGYLVITTKDNREIKVTGNHPIFTGPDYKEARLLQIGDTVFLREGNTVKPMKIRAIEVKDEIVDVYDLEIKETHNFFAQGVLVHNKITVP